VIAFFPCFMATEQYQRILRFDVYPLPWSHLGTINCPLVQAHKKRLQHASISELAASVMRQTGRFMVKTASTRIDCFISTAKPTSAMPTSLAPTSVEPTSAKPTSLAPTSVKPTSAKPTSGELTSVKPTSVKPTSVKPTSLEPTSVEPTSVEPASVEPTSAEPC